MNKCEDIEGQTRDPNTFKVLRAELLTPKQDSESVTILPLKSFQGSYRILPELQAHAKIRKPTFYQGRFMRAPMERKKNKRKLKLFLL